MCASFTGPPFFECLVLESRYRIDKGSHTKLKEYFTKVIGQFSHDSIACKTRVKLSSVIGLFRSVLLLFKSILLLVKLSWSVRRPFSGFVYVVDKVICKVRVVVDIGVCSKLVYQLSRVSR